MGMYLNPGNDDYCELLNSKIVIDKSLLIEKTNDIINTKSKYICISRPRRFGKSTDANMLVAYYSKGCDSHTLFDNLKISKTSKYEVHLNKHNVIHLNMQNFLSKSKNIDEFILLLSSILIREFKRVYEDVDYFDDTNLQFSLSDIFNETGNKFIFIIDEWDCLFREFKEDENAQKQYLDFLRDLFKDQKYVEMVYMTGILPVKKYGTHSALNMFDEISMIEQRGYSSFMGFTEQEVKNLCNEFDVNYQTMQQWYNGYHLEDDISVYSPRSVSSAIMTRKFSNYWSQTETFEALQDYIDLNLDGLKDNIVEMIAGNKVKIDTTSFQNDMTSLKSKDDVLTLLIHLGYLAFDSNESRVYIPNNEVKGTFITSIKNSNWDIVTKVFKNANDLLQATWDKDSKRVAKYIQDSHYETSILQYNDENALSYTIYLAYITAREYYTIVRELPTGKGFADITFIPRGDKPAMIVELKYNENVETAITQIKNKNYPKSLEHYVDNLLLVSINYDKKTKEHQCHIEKYE